MDIVNGLFELFASLFILDHCRHLYKDKVLSGVSWVSIVFFTAWGVWNLFYYPSLGQSFSFYAGILVVLSNLTWLGMIFYYRNNFHVLHKGKEWKDI